MASKPTVTLTVAGDSAGAEKALDQSGEAAEKFGKEAKASADKIETAFKGVGRDAARMKAEVVDSGKKFDDFADAADRAEQRVMGARDGVTGLQDAVGAFNASNPVEGLLLLGSGAADLASSLANSVVPAIKATITRLGALRTAAAGVGLAAVGTAVVIGLNAIQNATKAVEVNIDHAEEDFERFIRTGRQTQTVINLMQNGARSTKDWANAIRNFRMGLAGQVVSSIKDIFGEGHSFADVHQYKVMLEELDTAIAGYLDTTGDTAGAQQVLNTIFGDSALVTEALATDALPKYEDALKRTEERQWDVVDSVTAQVKAFQEATKEARTFYTFLNNQANPVFRAIDAQQAYAKAQERVNEALKEHGKDSPEYIKAVLDAAQANLNMDAAVSAASGSLTDDMIRAMDLTSEEARILTDAMAGVNAEANKLNVPRRLQIDVQINEHIRQSRASGLTPYQLSGGAGGFLLPRYHSGGMVAPHLSPGTEVLAILQAGEKVIPAVGSSGEALVLNVHPGGSGLDELFIRWLRDAIGDRGGNVQEVLGR